MNGKVDRARLTNRERLQKLVDGSGLNAALATSFENVTYTSGLYDPGMRRLNRTYIVIWPREGSPTFVVPQYRVGAKTFIQEVKGYDYYVRHELLKDPRGCSQVESSPMPTLAQVLKEKGLVAGRIGLEKAQFPAIRYEELRELLPSAEFVDCGSLFDEARMVKTPAEIELLDYAGCATEKAIRIGFELARPGDTARSVANSMCDAMTKLGADSMAFLTLDVVSNGRRLSYSDESVQLKKGDLVRVDAGGCFAGYHSDVARMAVVGEPSAEHRSAYHRLLGVQNKIINEITKPGYSGGELFELTSRAFKEAGFKTPWGMIVHGIGLFLHERPWFRELETHVLQPGMVLCVEVYYHGSDGEIEQQIEDLVLVTDTGARKLTIYSSTDEPFTIA